MPVKADMAEHWTLLNNATGGHLTNSSGFDGRPMGIMTRCYNHTRTLLMKIIISRATCRASRGQHPWQRSTYWGTSPLHPCIESHVMVTISLLIRGDHLHREWRPRMYHFHDGVWNIWTEHRQSSIYRTHLTSLISRGRTCCSSVMPSKLLGLSYSHSSRQPIPAVWLPYETRAASRRGNRNGTDSLLAYQLPCIELSNEKSAARTSSQQHMLESTARPLLEKALVMRYR